MSDIEILGRVVIVDQGHILLCRKIHEDHTFLPGGHIEYGESAKAGIVRELQEEIGAQGQIDDFLGVAEHRFSQEGQQKHELNLIFSGRLLDVRHPHIPPMLESHIKYHWQPLDRLHEAVLLPESLVGLIQAWLDQRRTGVWVSNIA